MNYLSYYFHKNSIKIHGSHRVFLRGAAIQRPLTTVEEARRPKQEKPHPNSRHQLAEKDWYSLSTCHCYTSRSSSASCYSRCATCNRNYRCSDPPTTETEMNNKNVSWNVRSYERNVIYSYGQHLALWVFYIEFNFLQFLIYSID